jgi:hypothetical protein
MSYHDFPSSTPSHEAEITPEARGALFVAEIENSLLRLRSLYSDRQAENKVATYTLENKAMLEYAGIPKSITDFIARANEEFRDDPLELDSAYIDIEIGNEQTSSNPSKLTLTFHLKSNDVLSIIRTVSSDSDYELDEDGDAVITHFYGDEVVGHITKRVLKEQDTTYGRIVSDTEFYDFLSSIAFIRDHDLSASSLVNKDKFRQYVHNPFSMSDLHRLLIQSAKLTRQESSYPTIEPIYGLPADITVCSVDDDSTSIEVELWDDLKRVQSTSVSIGVDKPLKDQNDEDNFFGTTINKRAPYLENSLLLFERGGFRYDPDLVELDEINTKLQALVDISDITAQNEELDSFDDK